MRRSALKRGTTPLKRSPMKRTTLSLKASPAKPRARINPIGKRGSEWIAVRKELKKRFEWAGIVYCEARLDGCWFHDSLGFAHCRKRRNLQDGEIWHVALLCNSCHDQIEQSTHDEMHAWIHRIIARRGLLVPPYVLQQIQKQADDGGFNPLLVKEGSSEISRTSTT